MRADFNTLANFYDGPGTATPGALRVANVPARVVSDLFFKDVDAPLSTSLAYFNVEASQPRGPLVTDLGGGSYTYDFTRADRVEFLSLPGTTWVVLRVETCTWPALGAPYWRASIANAVPDPIPIGCEFPDDLWVVNYSNTTTTAVERIGPTTWSGGGYSVELSGISDAPECTGIWTITYDGFTWVTDAWAADPMTATLGYPVDGAGYFLDLNTNPPE